MENEIWKPVVGYEGLYEVSSLGRIKSLRRQGIRHGRPFKVNGRILSQCIDTYGYCVVGLFILGDQKNKVHRLVAQAFILNPENKAQVNHINEVKSDNSALNLEWVTSKENVNHGTAIDRRRVKFYKGVIRMDLKGRILEEFRSLREADENGYTRQSITKVCRGARKTHKGFKWRYANED